MCVINNKIKFLNVYSETSIEQSPTGNKKKNRIIEEFIK